MKTGTRVIVAEANAKMWGYKTPAKGIIIGPDPDPLMGRKNLGNPNVFSVKLDQGPSIYECKGINVDRLRLECTCTCTREPMGEA